MNENAQAPAKRGRGQPPFEWTEERLQKVEDFSAMGMTLEDIATLVGCSPSTLKKKKAVWPELEARWRKGKVKDLAELTKTLTDKARAGDMTAIIFKLKARHGWKDRVAAELTGADGAPIEVNNNVSVAGGLERLRALLAGSAGPASEAGAGEVASEPGAE